VRAQRSYISGTIFTSGLNQAMRGHVLDASAERAGAVTCITDVGNCLGCKEPYYAGRDTDGGGGGGEDDDEAVCLLHRLPLTSMAKRFSLVHVLAAAARRSGGGVAAAKRTREPEKESRSPYEKALVTAHGYGP